MSIEMNFEQTFPVPPDALFALLSAPDQFAEWMPGLISVEPLNDLEGLGHQFLETRKVFGMKSTEHFEVTAWEPGQSLEFFIDGTKGTSKSGAYRFRYQFEPSEVGTRMVLRGSIEGLGPVATFIGRMFAGGMKKAIKRDHAALLAHLEQKLAA